MAKFIEVVTKQGVVGLNTDSIAYFKPNDIDVKRAMIHLKNDVVFNVNMTYYELLTRVENG